jgi:hypothetical protein
MLCCVLCLSCRTHLSPNHGPFPFPKDMFLKFVHENNGYFPVKIQALPEGTCVHVHTPVYQVIFAHRYSLPLGFFAVLRSVEVHSWACTWLPALCRIVWLFSSATHDCMWGQPVVYESDGMRSYQQDDGCRCCSSAYCS